MEKYKPGETVPKTGEYERMSKDGEREKSYHLEKHETFPPTQHEDSYYQER